MAYGALANAAQSVCAPPVPAAATPAPDRASSSKDNLALAVAERCSFRRQRRSVRGVDRLISSGSASIDRLLRAHLPGSACASARTTPNPRLFPYAAASRSAKRWRRPRELNRPALWALVPTRAMSLAAATTRAPSSSPIRASTRGRAEAPSAPLRIPGFAPPLASNLSELAPGERLARAPSVISAPWSFRNARAGLARGSAPPRTRANVVRGTNRESKSPRPWRLRGSVIKKSWRQSPGGSHRRTRRSNESAEILLLTGHLSAGARGCSSARAHARRFRSARSPGPNSCLASEAAKTAGRRGRSLSLLGDRRPFRGGDRSGVPAEPTPRLRPALRRSTRLLAAMPTGVEVRSRHRPSPLAGAPGVVRELSLGDGPGRLGDPRSLFGSASADQPPGLRPPCSARQLQRVRRSPDLVIFARAARASLLPAHKRGRSNPSLDRARRAARTAAAMSRSDDRGSRSLTHTRTWAEPDDPSLFAIVALGRASAGRRTPLGRWLDSDNPRCACTPPFASRRPLRRAPGASRTRGASSPTAVRRVIVVALAQRPEPRASCAPIAAV